MKYFILLILTFAALPSVLAQQVDTAVTSKYSAYRNARADKVKGYWRLSVSSAYDEANYDSSSNDTYPYGFYDDKGQEWNFISESNVLDFLIKEGWKILYDGQNIALGSPPFHYLLLNPVAWKKFQKEKTYAPGVKPPYPVKQQDSTATEK